MTCQTCWSGSARSPWLRSAGSKSGQVTDELFELGRLVDGTPPLRDALSDPGRSAKDKATLLDSLLGGQGASRHAHAGQTALAGTYRTMTAALTTYRTVAAESQGEVVATVRVARPLADADERRLTEVLSSQYDTTVHLNVVVDPDSSAASASRSATRSSTAPSTRLDEARRRLVG